MQCTFTFTDALHVMLAGCSGHRGLRAGRQTAGAVSAAASGTSAAERHRIAAGLADRPGLPGSPPPALGLRAVEPRPASVAASPAARGRQPLRHQRRQAVFAGPAVGCRPGSSRAACRQDPPRWFTRQRATSPDRLERHHSLQPV